MKKIRIIAVAAFVATALQLSCSAASILFNIPTVLAVDEYAMQNGRTVEEVLQTVETSAKEQLNGTTPVAPVEPTTPIIPTIPETQPKNDVYLTPSAEGALSGDQVVFTIINGIPTILKK